MALAADPTDTKGGQKRASRGALKRHSSGSGTDRRRVHNGAAHWSSTGVAGDASNLEPKPHHQFDGQPLGLPGVEVECYCL